MDLHIVGAEATEAERQAVDRLLGPPVSGWEGGARNNARDGRTAVGGRQVTGDRDLLLPDIPRGAGRHRLDQPRRAQLHLQAPVGAARGSLGRRHLLSPAGDRADTGRGRACVRRHRVPPERRRRVDRGARPRRGSRSSVRRALANATEASAALVTKAGVEVARFVLAPASRNSCRTPPWNSWHRWNAWNLGRGRL